MIKEKNCTQKVIMQLFGGLFLVGLAAAVQSDYCQSLSTNKLSQLVTIKKKVSSSLNFILQGVQRIRLC